MTISSTEVLKRAKKLLEEVGWCKGILREGTKEEPTAYCAMGAIYAIHDADDTGGSMPRARERLRKAIGKHIIVGNWNDRPTTTKKMVLAAFDKAINSTKKKVSKSK